MARAKGGPRFSRVVPLLLLGVCSLYVANLFYGTTEATSTVHIAAGVPASEVPSLEADKASLPTFTRAPLAITVLPSIQPVDAAPDEGEIEEPDEEHSPVVNLQPPSPAAPAKGSKPIRFYVHKLSKRFDAESLVKKHKKCEGFQWSNDLKFLRHVQDGRMTEQPSEADFFLVPFLSKCWFNFEAKYKVDAMERDFKSLVEDLQTTEAWKKWPDRHLFIFSSGVGPTLAPGWRKVRRGIFILAEGDRSAGFYESGRDIVIPGVGKATKGQVSIKDVHRPRSLLATFRGTLIRGHARDGVGKSVYCRSLLRQALLNLAKDRKDVEINDRRYTDDQGTLDKKSYKKELADSTFCIIPRGLTPWTSRLFDAIALDCIPVILSNAIVFPYERSIDYTRFTIKLPESWAGRLWAVLENIPKKEVHDLQVRVRAAAPLFLGRGPIEAIVGELEKLRSGPTGQASGTRNSMSTFWLPGKGIFELTGNEARQVGPSYSAGAQPHPPASELWVPNESFKKLVGDLWHEDNCVPCARCKFGQWFLR